MVSAPGLLNKTNGNHVGVDLNSLVSNVSEPASYFTDDDGRNVSVALESAQPIQAWLGDFGLARLYEHGADPATTRVVGTLGYMAPELTMTGKAADGFAFGVLLLEVKCGRRPFNPITGVNLLRWVRDHGVKGDLVHAVDERLEGCYDKEAKLVLWLSLMCRASHGRKHGLA